MSKIMIKAENISKKYNLGLAGSGSLYQTLGQGFKSLFKKNSNAANKEFWALKDINFEIKEGEVVGIVGRNGAGKSTLLKVLSRITKPTTGRVELNGRVASLLEVGTGFHPELTGRENVFLNGSILGMSRVEIRQKFDEIVDFSGIEKFLDTPVKRYSSGMYVRLAFAVAAHLESEILIIDEVLAVGDTEFQKKCLGKMGEVANSGRTILFVSHNMAAVKKMCTTGFFLKGGKVELLAPIEMVINSYLDESKGSEIFFENEIVKSVSITQIQQEIEITLIYENNKEMTHPFLGVVFKSMDDTPVFAFGPKLTEQAKLPRHNNQYYPNKGKIKINLSNPKLVDGIYYVSIFFGDDAQALFSMESCIQIEIIGMGAYNKIFSGNQVGYVEAEGKVYFEPIV